MITNLLIIFVRDLIAVFNFFQDFKMVIVDESHYIKNRKSATAKFVVPLIQQAPHKLLLTGTPALARPSEVKTKLNRKTLQKIHTN